MNATETSRSPEEHESPAWWGEFRLQVHETHFWKIGPLELWATRLPAAWQLASASSGDYLDWTLEHRVFSADSPLDSEAVPLPGAWQRFGFAESPAELHLRPVLADRQVVISPDQPFIIPGGERTTLYVSTPLWVRLSVGAAQRLLVEIPAWRPSDTWFGTPIEGELCYAGRTSARQEREALPERPHRAITPLVIDNPGRSPLPVTTFAMPVPRLALFADEHERLWTNGLILTREEQQPLARAQMEEGPPRFLSKPHPISPPRFHSTDRFMTRAFTSLFG